MATAVSILDTLANRNRVLVVARIDSKGFSIPNAEVCNTSPLRITAAPAEMSPRSTVAAATTASKAAPLKGPVSVVVVVAGVVVDVEVVVDVVDVEVLVEVVDVDAEVAGVVAGMVNGAVVGLLVSSEMVGGVVTDFAAVSSEELDADAKATTATPAAPITQKLLAIPPFSPLATPDRRHRRVPWATPSLY
jgi:hypothetical protein